MWLSRLHMQRSQCAALTALRHARAYHKSVYTQSAACSSDGASNSNSPAASAAESAAASFLAAGSAAAFTPHAQRHPAHHQRHHQQRQHNQHQQSRKQQHQQRHDKQQSQQQLAQKGDSSNSVIARSSSDPANPIHSIDSNVRNHCFPRIPKCAQMAQPTTAASIAVSNLTSGPVSNISESPPQPQRWSHLMHWNAQSSTPVLGSPSHDTSTGAALHAGSNSLQSMALTPDQLQQIQQQQLQQQQQQQS